MVAFKIGLLFSYVTFAFGKNVKNSEEFLYFSSQSHSSRNTYIAWQSAGYGFRSRPVIGSGSNVGSRSLLRMEQPE